jgi:hypothetical protein
MKKLLLLLCMAGLMLTFGCVTYSAPVMPPIGLIFEDVNAPLDANMDATLALDKSGSAESMSILSLFATGDCSINTAAKDGDLETIHYADYHYFNIIGIIQRFTVTVYGE